MSAVLIFQALLIAVYGAGALLAYRRWFVRMGIVLFVAALAGMVAVPELLGRPREVAAAVDGTVVISALPIPNVAIFLYVAEPDSTEPMSLRLPWDDETAQKIVEALEGAQQNGGVLMFNERLPGEPGSFEIELPPEPAPKQPTSGS